MSWKVKFGSSNTVGYRDAPGDLTQLQLLLAQKVDVSSNSLVMSASLVWMNSLGLSQM